MRTAIDAHVNRRVFDSWSRLVGSCISKGRATASRIAICNL
jgi:hypothetical protein